MKINVFPIFLIVILIIIFLIFYKGLQNPNIYEPKIEIGKKIPIFKAYIFDSNNEINSEEIFKGNKFYLINIWSSWCIPCRDEHPFLMKLRNQKKIEIIGINYKDKAEKAKKFLNELNNPYHTILTDKNGTIAIEWGAYGVPESFLIYNDKILLKIIGPLNENLLLKIKKIIK